MRAGGSGGRTRPSPMATVFSTPLLRSLTATSIESLVSPRIRESDKIIAGGGSAGGHISLLATTNPGLNDPRDSLEYDTAVAAYLLFNPALGASDARDPEVDFLQQLTEELSPTIVFFGTEDKWFKNGWKAATAKMVLLDVADSIELWLAEGQEHGFFNKQPWTDVTLIEADRFLRGLGYLEGEPILPKPETGERLTSANE